MKTAALLIGFGGPNSLEEVKPFLDSVLAGVRIPQARYDEVVHHYEAIGGASPYNAVTEKQKAALEKYFAAQKLSIEVFIGYRHAAPSYEDAFRAMKERGIEKAAGFVLSPLRCYASFEKYTGKVEEGRQKAGAGTIATVYTAPFNEHALFVKAQSEKVRTVLAATEDISGERTHFLFTAHSIPVPMDAASGYTRQFFDTSFAIARALGLPHWSLAYQSRSGNPNDPWLEPSVTGVIETLDPSAFSNVVLIPVGFLCDNVEVIYDLDIEARKTAEEKGFKYFRASTVSDDAAFIQLIGEQVCAALR